MNTISQYFYLFFCIFSRLFSNIVLQKSHQIMVVSQLLFDQTFFLSPHLKNIVKIPSSKYKKYKKKLTLHINQRDWIVNFVLKIHYIDFIYNIFSMYRARAHFNMLHEEVHKAVYWYAVLAYVNMYLSSWVLKCITRPLLSK